MKCQQSGCTADATCVVFWPGQTTRQCDTHAAALLALAKHMDCALEVGRLIPFIEPATITGPETE